MRFNIGRGAASGGLLLGLALAVAACGGGGGLGDASPPASLDPNSPTLNAANVAFDHVQLAVPANAPFVLVFDNQDTVGHNVSIYRDSAYQYQVFQGAIFSGPSKRWYPVPALTPGTYSFRCDLHPNMSGTIVAS
ncbi:MAG TPA: cupredoxin domain-containing protein [Candidatus Dormibacteraeota bacterium]|nr:cupredoxin domain-containing protein [Candidatus Dormibacteraeota bacterium]